MVYANITNGIVSLRLNIGDNISDKEYSYSLGDELFKFLSFDIPEVYALYIKVADVFMDYHYRAIDEKVYIKKLSELNSELVKHSVYLHLYTSDLLELMTELQKGSKYAMDAYIVGRALQQQWLLSRHELLTKDKGIKPYFDIELLENYQFDMSSLSEFSSATERETHRIQAKTGSIKTKPLSEAAMRKQIGLAVLFLAHDLKSKRAAYLGDISAISDNTNRDKVLDGLTLTQKLYMLDLRRSRREENALYSNYSQGLWKTTFEPYPCVPENLSDKKARDFILKNNVEYKQTLEIPHMDGLIVFELLSVLTSGAMIKKCRFCGNYFIPQGRSDTLFCDRVAKGESKPCRLIGSLKLHKVTKNENPIHAAHQKAYRRMNAKCRTARITQTEFFDWSEEARAKRDLCLKGEFDFAEFSQWLELDKEKAE